MPAPFQRIVRKVEPPRRASLDDQVWPVNASLLVLGSFLTGELVALKTGPAASHWSNAWMLIAMVWGAIFASMFLVKYSGGLVARRTQLSLVVTLVLFLALLTAFAFFPIFTSQLADEAGKREIVKLPEVTMPDYVQVETMDEPPLELQHERPVDTKTPETPTREVVQKKIEPTREVEQAQPKPEPTPEVTKQAEPTLREKPVPTKTPPRHSETASRLSRQATPTPPQPNRVASPTVAKASQPKPSTKIRATTRAITPRKTEAVTQRPTSQETPTTQSRRPTIETARHATPSATHPTVSTTRRQPKRSVRPPTELPKVTRVTVQTPTRVAQARQPKPSRREPSRKVTRRTTASPVVARATPDAKPEPSVRNPATKQARATPSPKRETLARNHTPSPTRAVQHVPTPTTTQAASPTVATHPSQASPTPVEAKTAAVARKAVASAPAESSSPTATNVTGAVTTQATQSERPRRSTVSSVPSVLPNHAPSEQPRRSHRVARASASPSAVSRPAAVQSAEANPSATQPRATSLSRSRRGMAGAGQQKNLDRGEPARRTVSDVASASARRKRATSESPEPGALATSRQARVAKGRAMAYAPAATLEAHDVEVASVAGVKQPSDIDASSSAAMRNRSAATHVSSVTADAGSTDFDTGPTQIASELSSGRASGGGEPEVNHATQTPDASRLAAKGGAHLAAIDTEAIAPQPSDVAADGGGVPEANLSARAITQVRRLQKSGDAGPASLATNDGERSTTAEIATSAPQAASAQAARSLAPQTLSGATAGGGTERPMRESGATFTAATQADSPVVAEVGSGESAPSGIDAPAPTVARHTDGAAGAGPVADLAKADLAEEGEEGLEVEFARNAPTVGAPGRHAGATSADEWTGAVREAGNASGGAPLRTASTAAIPGITKVTVDATDLAGGGADAAPTDDPVRFGAGEGSVERRQAGGTQALVQAELGEGGLSAEPSLQAGNPSRKAQRHSEVITVSTDARFKRRDLGGPKFSGNTRARNSQSAFEGRKKRPGVEGASGTPPRALEVAITSGLEFLRRHQTDNGSWSFNDLDGPRSERDRGASIQSDAAATGLALMCFLGAGYDHFDYGGKYTREIQASLDYLVQRQQEDGNLYVERDSKSSTTAALYSHAIATMALCEAYGMTRDPKLKTAAQNAIEYIEKTQHSKRGGWRYIPGQSSDLSVTGWMIAALKSGELAGLKVQTRTYEAASKYLRSCRAGGSDGTRYVYNPQAPDSQRHGRRASVSMTAVGLLLQLYEGRDRTDRALQRGADLLAQNLPEHSPRERDTYYWYYATQVMFHMRGDYWDRWEKRLQRVLWSTQDQSGPMAGSWNPRGAIPDRWGSHGGRIYVTTMNLLSLEVSYRYLPLYQETDR